MQTEIEAKFLDVSFDDIREKLKTMGGECEQPMRTMRRVAIDNKFMRTGKDSFLRVRDEGHRVTMTYKQYDESTVDGTKEIEVEVSDYKATVAILEQCGLVSHTVQETRRENWRLGDVEIMLDEWPWLNPFIEIEAHSEEKVREIAGKLGLKWEDALFGGVMAVYRKEYPHMSPDDNVANVPVVKFGDPLPPMLAPKK